MITRFGISAGEIVRLLRPLGDDDDETVMTEGFARSAWSMIAEPGDGAAGIVVAALGPVAALDLLVGGVDAITLASRVDPTGLAQAVALQHVFDDALRRWRPRLRARPLVQALEAASRCHARLLVPDGPGWPGGVDDLGVHAPLALWLRGSAAAVAALDRSVALVGARACTKYGEAVTAELAAGLSDRGFAVVSGAAYGVDGAAHRAALGSGGITVAFLAGGVDRFYPAGHEQLLGRIVAEGAVLAEQPCGYPPAKWRFLQRNRLIAAASSATVVVEAGKRSGSINTAGHAAQLGRPLGAIPGPVTSAASAGCHRLLREYDARCVTDVDSVIELVTGEEKSLLPDVAERSSEQTRVVDALSPRSVRSPDQIAALSGLSTGSVLAALAGLELDGAVHHSPGGWLRG